jgi:hypothetical protein
VVPLQTIPEPTSDFGELERTVRKDCVTTGLWIFSLELSRSQNTQRIISGFQLLLDCGHKGIVVRTRCVVPPGSVPGHFIPSMAELEPRRIAESRTRSPTAWRSFIISPIEIEIADALLRHFAPAVVITRGVDVPPTLPPPTAGPNASARALAK